MAETCQLWAYQYTICRSIGCRSSFCKPLPVCVCVKGQKLLGEFEAVMQENKNSMKITDKHEWWSRRRALNTQLEVGLF